MKPERPFFDLLRSMFNWFLIGWVTLLIFFPLVAAFLAILPFDRDRKNLHPLVSIWAKAVLAVCPMMKVQVAGYENLCPNETYIFVANHQSISDIIAVLHIHHPFKFIAKQDLFWIPLMGWALWLAGYIPLVRGDHTSGRSALQKARGYLRRGTSVLFFPEGTRSHDGEIQHFKIGAFKLAAELNVPVVPVVIDGTNNLIPKGSRFLARHVEVTLTIQAPQAPPEKNNGSVEAFCERVRTEMIRALKEKRLSGEAMSVTSSHSI